MADKENGQSERITGNMKTEKQNMTASIIVPVYKSGLLKRCIDSLTAQTYPDLEIILVDDGSPDGAGKICDEYADKDQRIRVIHQKNGGISAARNTGLDACRGDVIYFSDDDDFSDPHMVEDSMDLMEKENADIVIFYAQESFGGTRGEVFDWHMRSFPSLTQEDIRRLAFGGCLPTPWGKAYRRRLWEHVRFPVSMYSEDRHVEVDLWNQIKKAAVLPYVYYYWELSPHGSASAKWNSLQAYGLWSSWKKHEELKGLREADRVVYQWNERMAAASAVYHQELDHFLTEEQYGAMADVIEEGGTVFPSFSGNTVLAYYHFCCWKVIQLASEAAGGRALIDSHFLGRIFPEDCLDHAMEGLYRNRTVQVLTAEQEEELRGELRKSHFEEDRLCRTLISYVEYKAKEKHKECCEELPPFWSRRACRYAMQILSMDSVEKKLNPSEKSELRRCVVTYDGPMRPGYRWMRWCLALDWQQMMQREGKRLMRKLAKG